MPGIFPVGQAIFGNMSPQHLVAAMKENGCTRLLAKRLSPNDNSKNQIYLGGDYSALNLLPFGRLVEDETVVASSKRARLKADVLFYWLGKNGLEPADHANLILYPKYPEVRLSGMLFGLQDKSPNKVIATRDEGRWLFLGVGPSARVVAHAVAADSDLARWAEAVAAGAQIYGVFHELPLTAADPTAVIKAALSGIALKGWIRSKRLDALGAVQPCESENCGGYTLEAELGIRPNGRADPDYDGWEVKQFSVRDLSKPVGDQITLFTPEPDGGHYASEGVESFLRSYGYPDKSGIPDRINFGGAHVFGVRHKLTNLRLGLTGWDADAKKITAISGGIRLEDASGAAAAVWSYASLINHWKRKHAKAAFVPCNKRTGPREYRYGFNIFAGTGTDFPLVLDALVRGEVFYDPGIKMEQASSKRPEIKRRSQFRIRFRNLKSLYHNTGWWDLS